MLEEAYIPIKFWLEVLEAYTVIRNVLPNGPEVNGFQVSPKEAFLGLKPSVLHFKV